MLKTLQLGVVALIEYISACGYSTGGPTVMLGDAGTVVGATNSTFGLDSFLGIPFAQPPVGPLRWRIPISLAPKPSRVIRATAWGPACIQVPFSVTLPTVNFATSEDCLSINVVRPAGLRASAKLPVLVWIHGGGFFVGASLQYDPAFLVRRSVQMGEPIVFVSMNYRLNSFGFLASEEVSAAQKDGSGTLNAGLHDIQAALSWVQKNIDKFGGDPTKVTAFGESAGAIAIGSLLVAGRGQAVQRLKLFRGAIMESGAPSGDGVPAPSYFESNYRNLASMVGCGPALSKGRSLQCLRGVSAEALTNATKALCIPGLTFLFNRVQDGYFHDALPSDQVRSGRLATVPLLMGTTLDEGTLFADTTLNSASDLANNLVNNQWYDADASPAFNATIIPKLFRLYPDNPIVGSPYDPVGISKSDRFYGPTNQYKRAASIIGDTLFDSGRRLLLKAYTEKSDDYPVYNYLFTENTPLTSPPALGVFHTSEIPFVFGQYAALALNTTLGIVSNYMSSTWIAFANNLNPNRPPYPQWPRYGRGRATLKIGTDTSDGSYAKVITDDFRDEQIAFLGSEAWTKEVNT